MEFISEKTDLNVAEFYELFSESLPKVVRVNQGYFGEIASDVFDKDQVIWLNAVSKQQRVIAKFQLPNHSMRLLSIPVTYEERLCVVKHTKLGKPKLLRSILEKGHFPLTVQFPKDHHITVGNHSVSTNHIPKLELTETFEEMYFLGNYVNEGIMCDDVIDIPLYLSQLRFSLVTGIKEHTAEQWSSFVQNLVTTSSAIVYDHTFGNPDLMIEKWFDPYFKANEPKVLQDVDNKYMLRILDVNNAIDEAIHFNIAEYDPSAIHSCDAYSYLEPTLYSNIVSLVNKPHLTPTTSYQAIEKEHSTFAPKNDSTEEDLSVYDQVDVTSNNETAAKRSVTDSKSSQNGSKSSPTVAVSGITDMSQSTQPTLPPKQQYVPTDINITTTSNTKAPIHTSEHHGPPPPLMPKPSHHKPAVKVPVPVVRNAEDVVKLSIDEVGEYLKRLKLEDHVDQFKASMIDGSLLVDISKDMLIGEFGFKHSEVLRLMAFAQRGHIPS